MSLPPVLPHGLPMEFCESGSKAFNCIAHVEPHEIQTNMLPFLLVTSYHVAQDNQVHSESMQCRYDAITGNGLSMHIRDHGIHTSRPYYTWDKWFATLRMEGHTLVVESMGNNQLVVSMPGNQGVYILSATPTLETTQSRKFKDFDGLQIFCAIQVGNQTLIPKEYRVMLSVQHFPVQEPQVGWKLRKPTLKQIYDSISNSPLLRDGCAEAVKDAPIPSASREFVEFLRYTEVCKEHLIQYLAVFTKGDTERAQTIMRAIKQAAKGYWFTATSDKDPAVEYLDGTCFFHNSDIQGESDVFSAESLTRLLIFQENEGDEQMESGLLIIPHGAPRCGRPYRNILITGTDRSDPEADAESPDSGADEQSVKSGVASFVMFDRSTSYEDPTPPDEPDEARGFVTFQFDARGVIIGLANSRFSVGVVIAGFPVLLRYPENLSVRVQWHVLNHVIIQYPLDKDGERILPNEIYYIIPQHFPRKSHEIIYGADYIDDSLGDKIPLAPPTDKCSRVAENTDITESSDPEPRFYVWPDDEDETHKSFPFYISDISEPSPLFPLETTSVNARVLSYLNGMLRTLDAPLHTATRKSVELARSIVLQVQETYTKADAFLEDVWGRLEDESGAYDHIREGCAYAIPGTPKKVRDVLVRVNQQLNQALVTTPNTRLERPDFLWGVRKRSREERLNEYARRDKMRFTSTASRISFMIKTVVGGRQIWDPRLNRDPSMGLRRRARLFHANQNEMLRDLGRLPLEYTCEEWETKQNDDFSGVSFRCMTPAVCPPQEETQFANEIILGQEGGRHRMILPKFVIDTETGEGKWDLPRQCAEFRDKLLKARPRPMKRKRKAVDGADKHRERPKCHILEVIGVVHGQLKAFYKLTPSQKEERTAIATPKVVPVDSPAEWYQLVREKPIPMPPPRGSGS